MDARSALRFRARDPFCARYPAPRATSWAEADARHLVRVRWRSDELPRPPFDAGLLSTACGGRSLARQAPPSARFCGSVLFAVDRQASPSRLQRQRTLRGRSAVRPAAVRRSCGTRFWRIPVLQPLGLPRPASVSARYSHRRRATAFSVCLLGGPVGGRATAIQRQTGRFGAWLLVLGRLVQLSRYQLRSFPARRSK
jgi:hypothetical protein